MKKYRLVISFAGFGTEQQVKEQFSKDNKRVISIDTSEFLGTDEEHHSGSYEEIIECNSINSFMKDYIENNSCYGECFGVYQIGGNKEIFTEQDIK